MSRISVEARAAAATSGGACPHPPPCLSKRARAIWAEIVRSKSSDWFDPGSLGLLARYCTLLAYAEALERRLGSFAGDAGEVLGAAEELRKTSASLTTLATKLRLSVQSTVRHDSGKLSEKGPSLSPLVGGKAVPFVIGGRGARREGER